jgi:hypothetical protein
MQPDSLLEKLHGKVAAAKVAVKAVTAPKDAVTPVEIEADGAEAADMPRAAK